MTSRTPPKRNAATATIALLFLFVASAFAVPVKFDIPAQPAPAAIKLFMKQSGTRVAYVEADLKDVSANALVGEFEPAAGLDVLLKATGCLVSQRQAGWFSVAREQGPKTTGSVKGSLTGEGGKGVANVLISIRETSQSAETDKYGIYVFPNVAAGTYVLVASAPGYQTMHITDVQVRAGRELTLGKEEMRRAKEGVLTLEPFVVKADTVEQLEKFEVTGAKQKPFESGNMDIPRTINDVQPYYIFDSKMIDRSGAINIEDFLKRRLTMNTVVQTNSQTQGTNTNGNTSSINLRGLGTDKTLILINGRRVAGVQNLLQSTTATGQPDLNGIPLDAIDRIEVLPSSASGIYGGSAIGGVVNVILKRDFSGGEIRLNYDNVFDTDSPNRAASITYGFPLSDGKTRVMLSASWSDSEPFLFRDRLELFRRGLDTLLVNSPDFLFSSSSPFLGSLPNVTPNVTSSTTLPLKNGSVIQSRNTFVPAGTSNSTSLATLSAGLLSNAGQWDLNLPLSTQASTGLLRPLTVTPTTSAYRVSLNRQFGPTLQVFADYSYAVNKSRSVFNSFGNVLVRAAAPTNPFSVDVRVTMPSQLDVPLSSDSRNSSLTIGSIVSLPFRWNAEFDYAWSQNQFKNLFYNTDSSALTADLLSGVLNPFVDSLQNPQDLWKYLVPTSSYNKTYLHDFALRGSGPLASLPWGEPNLTVGLEHRISGTPTISSDQLQNAAGRGTHLVLFARKQTTDSGYAEATVPLVKKDWIPLVHALELQTSFRGERFTVDTGTPSSSTALDTGVVTYGNPTLDGQPFRKTSTYTSENFTAGFKYEPVADIALRASTATAFLPPTPNQLTKNTAPGTSLSSVNDPVKQTTYSVQTIAGGNPDLIPQHSKSRNAGIVWEPSAGPLKGLRLNAEYYLIEQFEAIGTLTAQQIVSLESIYPDRVIRDSGGLITLVDVSMVNLFYRSTEGWDFSVGYSRATPYGAFSLDATATTILHNKQQISLTLPKIDYVGFPSEGGVGKHKGNMSLAWEHGAWSAGWSMRYFGSYKQSGAAGGPASVQSSNGGVNGTTVKAQGSDTIPSQLYHDVFVAFAFSQARGRADAKAGWFSKLTKGLSLQVGVENVFDTWPPLDVFYQYYSSPYGDIRLRSYQLSLRKKF